MAGKSDWIFSGFDLPFMGRNPASGINNYKYFLRGFFSKSNPPEA